MGIKGLGKFLSEAAPGCVKQIVSRTSSNHHDNSQELKSLVGRTLAIDASMSLYQFLIAIRDGDTHTTLVNEAGEATSHIAGFLSRVVKLVEQGIKPVYVFDGQATALKSGELLKRREKREEAQRQLEAAKDTGDQEEIRKFMGRIVRVTAQHNEDVKKLLALLGCPILEAPNEAEAQCAKLAQTGAVWATATEDADALTFGSPILIRHLGAAGAAKAKPILQFTLARLLEDLQLSMDEFIDFCILCGCDYCDRLRGIGPTTAYKLIQQHKCIEKILESDAKIVVPEVYPYKEAREFFKNPEVTAPENTPQLVWGDPDFDGLRTFLIDGHSFSATRVDQYITRLKQARRSGGQTRLESFFGAVQTKPPTKQKAKPGVKRAGGNTQPARKKAR